MSVPVLDQQSFPTHLAANKITVVKFGAVWCGPCKAMAPMLEKFASEFPGVSIVEVDVDKSPALAAQFNIRSLPTLVAWKNGTIMWAKVGLPPQAALRADLTALLS